MLAWSVEALTAKLPFRRWAWAAALAVLTVTLVRATSAQTANWKNSETLWTAALEANPNIALAENNLGYIDEHKSLFEKAFKRYEHAVEIRPRYVEARINLGNMYMNQAQSLGPADQQKIKDLTDEAEKHYRAAIEIRPDYDLGYLNLGAAQMGRGEIAEAEANFRKALQANPQNVGAYRNLGSVLYRQRKFDEAISCYTILLQVPTTAGEATEMLGYLYYLKHEPRKALEYWSVLLNANPDSLSVITMTAWLLATDPDAAVRDGNKAVALAERALRISQGRNSAVLIALAAAYAETGDFTRAAQTIEQAGRLPDRPMADAGLAQLQRQYQSRNRYYDPNALVLMPAGTTK
jgi:tetratricopeptide (TPR) repeat protein